MESRGVTREPEVRGKARATVDQGVAIRTRETNKAQRMMDLELCERRAKVKSMGWRAQVECRV